MAQNFFEKYPKYQIVEKPDNKLINKYKNILPDSFIAFWKEYGFGCFMNGYLKIVNPDDYQEVLDEGYDNTDGGVVFAVTGLGDFLLWEGDCIRHVNFRYGDDHIVEVKDDFNWFLNKDMADDYFIKEELHGENYFSAKEQYGDIAFDECFGYVPLLGIGGAEKVENLQKVKIVEHIYIIAAMMGQIEG